MGHFWTTNHELKKTKLFKGKMDKKSIRNNSSSREWKKLTKEKRGVGQLDHLGLGLKFGHLAQLTLLNLGDRGRGWTFFILETFGSYRSPCLLD